ncbi:MAG: hypothetical protein ACRC10_06685 [Thermoguttaceae bacterium]
MNRSIRHFWSVRLLPEFLRSKRSQPVPLFDVPLSDAVSSTVSSAVSFSSHLLFLVLLTCYLLLFTIDIKGAEQYSFESARPVFRRTLFAESAGTSSLDWLPESSTRLYTAKGNLIVEALGTEPSFYHLFNSPCNQLQIRFRLKTRVKSDCQISWITQEMPQRDPSKSVSISLNADDNWHDYSVILPVEGHLSALSIRLTGTTGRWTFGSFDLKATVPHPILVKNAVRQDNGVQFTLFNTSRSNLFFTIEGIPGDQVLESRRSADFLLPIQIRENLGQAVLRIDTQDFPTAVYPLFLYLPDEKGNWLQHSFGPNQELLFEVTSDARIARISRQSHNSAESPTVLAILAPLVHQNGRIPDFQVESGTKDGTFQFRAANAILNLTLQGDELSFLLEPVVLEEPFEGPVVRVLGPLQGGLLSGVELLGPGDTSSSTIDLAEPNNIRYTPPKIWITAPLAALSSDQIGVGLLWNDPDLQPIFASPNSMDLSEDHRMSLQGTRIGATVRFIPVPNAKSESTTDSVVQESGQSMIPELIRWGISKRGLAPLPAFPRSEEEQKELILSALTGPLQGEDKMSWGYYVESDATREPYADVLSTLFRLTGNVPKISAITPGGSVITNDTIYFVTNRVEDWKDWQTANIQKDLENREADGTFHKRSLFPEWESQQTVFGLNARKAAFLLDYAQKTGDRKVLESTEKTLRWLLQSRIPRGGHYWDSPFHTPDLLASAYAVWALTRGFELTKKPEYLEGARRYALLGLPFVYLWGTQPIQLYTTVPMFGGTEREKAWFGVAQPFSGLIYGYALCQLAPYDSTFDWKQIAKGLLIAAEQMQYADGPYAGCLPDEFLIEGQLRQSSHLNPCGLVSLQLAIEGKVDSLTAVSSGNDTIAAPFPIQANKRGVVVRDVPSGLRFEMLINGQQVIPVQGSGSGKDQVRF